LSGDGIELGALNSSLDLSGNTRVARVRYVDRWDKAEVLHHFPELQSDSSTIVETDVKCDFIRGLTAFDDRSVDFVIACHIIEHMPDPIFFLDVCWRLLRPGGILFLAVPDKTYLTFDAKRSLTPLKHLTEDHAKQVREVEDHHIEEFLRLSENLDIPSDTV
jgi:predicted SAM-dependent methyltransferase